MCSECIPPLTRPFDIRSNGSGFLILTKPEPHGIMVYLEKADRDVMMFRHDLPLGQKPTCYRVYYSRHRNKQGKKAALQTLEPAQYTALVRFSNTLFQGLRNGRGTPSSIWYHSQRLVIESIDRSVISFWHADRSERHKIESRSAAHIINGAYPSTPDFQVHLAQLGEAIWSAAFAQNDLFARNPAVRHA